MFLTYGGGLTGLYGAIAAYSAVSGTKFEFGAAGSRGGVPLASSWPAVAVLLVAAVGLFALGRVWDRPGFAVARQRRRWLVLAPCGRGGESSGRGSGRLLGWRLHLQRERR